jgi:hypothetical protein
MCSASCMKTHCRGSIEIGKTVWLVLAIALLSGWIVALAIGGDLRKLLILLESYDVTRHGRGMKIGRRGYGFCWGLARDWAKLICHG